MNIEKSREQFEAWNPLPPGCIFHEGKYGFWLVLDESGEPEFSTGMGLTQNKWEAWQASRQSLVIELPQRCSYELQGMTNDANGDYLDYEETVAAIQLTGAEVE